jgi:hypothetical protein
MDMDIGKHGGCCLKTTHFADPVRPESLVYAAVSKKKD